MWLFCVLSIHPARHCATTNYKVPQLLGTEGTGDAALERRRRNGLVHACATADGVAKFTAMRIVSILSGLAVLFTTLAFGHLMHRYFVNAGEAAHSPPFLAGMAIGIVVGIFSLIGACLLLRRGR